MKPRGAIITYRSPRRRFTGRDLQCRNCGMRAISNQQGAMDGPGSACRTFAVSTLGSLIVALATGACVAFATGASATAGSDSIELLNNTNPSGAAIALDRTTQDRQPSGNPLWAIPLRALTVTRDRPIFSPSRRPPAAAVIAAPAPP